MAGASVAGNPLRRQIRLRGQASVAASSSGVLSSMWPILPDSNSAVAALLSGHCLLSFAAGGSRAPSDPQSLRVPSPVSTAGTLLGALRDYPAGKTAASGIQIPLTTRINNIFSCKTVRNVSIASLSKVHLSICDGLEAPDMEHGVELPQVQYEDKPWIITTITYLILWDPNAIIQLHVDGLQYNSTKTRNFLKKSPKCATLKIPPELERNAQKNVIFGKCRNS
ncbi:uncharacterized protein [Phyllobates terribilis]|uniref:uncharacterized protein n=1 Tax=Phyllobates terribilis TaxID=111132 RepID=UPI003CCA70FD